MTQRVFNFGAGPAVLPEVVLEEARRHLLALPGVGMSVLEISHRSKTFTEIIRSAEANIRELANLSEEYHVLFLQGGATQQFAMVPMNLLSDRGIADYVVTGAWATKAANEAERFGTVHVAASTEAEGFACIPSELDLSHDAAYVHVTSNNTICGTQWRTLPDTGEVPLVVDASSDIFSRPLDLAGDGVGLLYGGAQKNLGPAGVTLVVVRDDLVKRAVQSSRTIPTMMCYSTYTASASLHNTPPVFAIYLVDLVTRWLLDSGGLTAVARCNQEKAQALYDAIDRTDFYRGTAEPGSRSLMNVTVRLPSEGLESQFVAEATAAGLAGLKGHRSVGGIRASIYNALPRTAVDALVDFMAEFERVNG